MGYKFGRHKYGEGLYSRWPDWWEQKECENDEWTDQGCEISPWTPVVPAPDLWTDQTCQPPSWGNVEPPLTIWPSQQGRKLGVAGG